MGRLFPYGCCDSQLPPHVLTGAASSARSCSPCSLLIFLLHIPPLKRFSLYFLVTNILPRYCDRKCLLVTRVGAVFLVVQESRMSALALTVGFGPALPRSAMWAQM